MKFVHDCGTTALFPESACNFPFLEGLKPISSLFCIVLYLLIRYACSRVTMHDMPY